MLISEPPGDEGQLYTRVDDEQYDELSELTGQQVVHVSVWEEGLADAVSSPGTKESAGDDTEVAADIDLYLRDGVYFELYGTLCYTDIDAAPLTDLRQIEQELQRLVEAGAQLEEIAVDEDDGLVLVLGQNHQPVIYLQVGAWLLDEWEELPESSAP
ncbi:MAG: hypothetical protein IT328_07475 [Caldilineaceae bacterium]|nr:hypothetical protein [Caldilineaceae bacterium]